MKKIAIFQRDLNIGGIEKSIINLLNNIDYTNLEIDLYLIEKDNIYIDELSPKVNVYYLKRYPQIFNIIPYFILKRINKNKLKKEYDIAIDFNFYDISSSIHCISTKAKKRILWVHNNMVVRIKANLKFRLLHMFSSKKYKYYDSFVGVSKGTIKAFKKIYNKPKKEYKVIPNYIDYKEIASKSKEKHNIKIDNKKVNIVSVGRLVYQKGYDLLIEYIKELVKVRKDFHLYIIGGGNKYKELNKMIKKYNLNNYITLLGYRKNPYSIMKDMDAFVLPSRYEGQGMVYLEAKYLGLDVIMPKYLEEFVGIDLKGTDNFLEKLKELKKNEKKERYTLKEYNEDILKRFNNL